MICELRANMMMVSKTLIAAMSSSSCWSNDIWHGASSAANTSDEWPRDGPRLGHSDTLRHETSTYPDGLAEQRMTMHCDADQGASQSHISSNWNKWGRISISTILNPKDFRLEGLVSVSSQKLASKLHQGSRGFECLSLYSDPIRRQKLNRDQRFYFAFSAK